MKRISCKQKTCKVIRNQHCLIGVFGLYILCTLMVFGCKKPEAYRGCTDPYALNYDPNASETKELCSYPLTLKQSVLDMSRNLKMEGKSGCTIKTSDLLPACFAVSDKNASSDSSYRKTYVNMSPIQKPIQAGVFIAQHVFTPKGKLVGIYAMYKQPTKYFPEGGDFEYLIIDPETASDTVRNGVLPEIGVKRGKLKDCALCHARAKNAFLFNDFTEK